MTLDAEVERLATLAAGAPMDAPVPSCPDWSLRDLVSHIGGVHRWAARHVQEYSPVRIPSSTMDFGEPASDDGYPDWLRAGGVILAETFAAADLDRPMWAWGLDQHARFWPRRMLHETTVHRVDAELALGLEPVVDAAVAADGIEELLDNIPCAASFAPNVEKLRGEGETLVFTSDDAAWTIRLEVDGFRWSRGVPAALADVQVRAPAAGDLLLFLYGRRHADESRFSVQGGRDLLARWLANSAL
jgi:uncharacterized protein (TIGR03083 family)